MSSNPCLSIPKVHVYLKKAESHPNPTSTLMVSHLSKLRTLNISFFDRSCHGQHHINSMCSKVRKIIGLLYKWFSTNVQQLCLAWNV